MSKKKIYIAGGDDYYDYINWILKMGFVQTKILEQSDLVLFAGGSDVHHSLYSNMDIKESLSSTNLNRDIQESSLFNIAQLLNKKTIGICRGSQFLCVMAGGRLVQDMSHPSTHMMTTIDNQEIEVSSSHHQMQYPFDLKKSEYQILGYCNLASNCYLKKNTSVKVPVDVENCWYKNINALAIQSHPEWQDPYGDSVMYFQSLLNDFMDDTGVFEKNYKSPEIKNEKKTITVTKFKAKVSTKDEPTPSVVKSEINFDYETNITDMFSAEIENK